MPEGAADDLYERNQPGTTTLNSAEISADRCVALVVEDEWLLRLDLVDALEESGLFVIEAEAAEDAMDSFAAGDRIDVLVTDIRLAGDMSGWDLAEAFRQWSPAGGVVYASANVALPDRQVEGSLFFTKPVSANEIARQCLRLCEDAKGDS